ncbi:hypothetical protein BH11PLA2_BH11PLA2_26120 [soil metagenome]
MRDRHNAERLPAPRAGAGRQEYNVARIIASGSKLYLLSYSTHGTPINEENLKTFFDSFEAK